MIVSALPVMAVEPTGPLVVSIGGAVDLLTDAAIAGTGIVALFEDWLRPHFESGVLEPVLEPWWQRFDFIKASPHQF